MPSERRWIILAQDGRHVTMGRAAPPSEAEVEAARQREMDESQS